jgi:WD40 repeat protein
MVRIVRQPEGMILALAYSRDGGRLFSAGTEGVIRVIDGDSDAILQKWKAHDDWIYSLALSPNGKILATGDWQGIIKLWDASSDVIRPITSDEPGSAVPQPKERGRLRRRDSQGPARLCGSSHKHADADVCAPIRQGSS